MTAVPSVPVPDLDTIRQRAGKMHSRRCPITSPRPGITAVCDCRPHRILSPDDFDSLVSRLVAVEAERDTLAAKIKAVRAMTRHGPFRTAELGHQHEWLHTADINATLDFVDADVSVVPGEREREG